MCRRIFSRWGLLCERVWAFLSKASFAPHVGAGFACAATGVACAADMILLYRFVRNDAGRGIQVWYQCREVGGGGVTDSRGRAASATRALLELSSNCHTSGFLSLFRLDQLTYSAFPFRPPLSSTFRDLIT